MQVELDHVFVCVSQGAPEAEKLVDFGLVEGSPNVHPGQGTANRRFFFQNAMLELLWVEDPVEAQSKQTTPTRLWERWSGRSGHASPFGIVVRPTLEIGAIPFPSWEYRPSWLPSDLEIHVAATGVEEPMWVYMPFLRREDQERRFSEHTIGIREITRLTLVTPEPLLSPAAHALAGRVFFFESGKEHMLSIEFDHGLLKQETDLRPHLPLTLRR
jgi:hypothetical protein